MMTLDGDQMFAAGYGARRADERQLSHELGSR
jgi:hypothetical protein